MSNEAEMMQDRNELTSSIAALLEETAKAHQAAFVATDGADPDWAMWYANHLVDPLSAALKVELSRTAIVCLLVELDEALRTRPELGPWPAHYASEFVSRFVPAVEEQLSLYIMRGCPYCIRVMQVVEKLGIDIEMRDIFAVPAHRDDLIAARGRGTVPVLRCTGPGVDRWLPESRDIIRYLEDRFGG